ncbi:hypothetical protein D3C75_1006740 [compost metagenome]
MGNTVFLYKGDVILFFEDFFYDNNLHNSLNLSELYRSFLLNGDSTTFDDFYFSINKLEDLAAINNNYDYVISTILSTIHEKKEA